MSPVVNCGAAPAVVVSIPRRTESVARLSRLVRFSVLAALLVMIGLLIACKDPRDWFSTRLVALEVIPAAAVMRPGERKQFSVLARYSDGRLEPVAGVPLTASARDVAAVADRTVAAERHGLTSITAKMGTVEGHALLAVVDRPEVEGPLRRSPVSRRYFADRHGQPVYLTGSHTWTSLQDSGVGDFLPMFDFERYLDVLESNGHNFIRLWRWEQAQWFAERSGEARNDPMPYLRPGPGLALDGRPRFDLNQLNDAYFARLRDRVERAGRRGMFVSVMLFNGWSLELKGAAMENPWRGHPYHRDNNINGVDGDPQRLDQGVATHRLGLPVVLRAQEAYVRRVVETLADLDNVLYEISNESTSPSMPWQLHLVRFIRELERGLPRQHPVGVTAERPGESNDALFASGADWIAPFRHNARPLEPFAWHGDLVIVNDTDHLCGVCGSVPWAWRSLTRGQNPIMMDPYDASNAELAGVPERLAEEDWAAIRRNMGWARVAAEWIGLADAEPYGGVVSSGHALARLRGGAQRYVVFLDGHLTVEIFSGFPRGRFKARWLDTRSGRLTEGGMFDAKGSLKLDSPAGEGAVLFLEQVSEAP